MHPNVHSSIFSTAMMWKQLKCLSIDKWIKQRHYTATVEYYSAIKKNVHCHVQQHEQTTTQHGLLQSETGQTEKDKYCMISLVCEI